MSEGATSEDRLTGVFIDVEVDDSIADDAELARKLAEVCPVDIFTAEDGRVETVPENLDECVLCELCLEAAPPGGVVVRKLYDGTELRRGLSAGGSSRSGTRENSGDESSAS